MSRLANQLSTTYPETNQGMGVDLRPASTVPGQMRGALIGFMTILIAIVGLVLLIACGPIPNVLQNSTSVLTLLTHAGCFPIISFAAADVAQW